MNRKTILLLLSKIEDEWRRLRPRQYAHELEAPPWGVWIKVMAPLSVEVSDISYSYEETVSQLQAVWFLSADGLHEENVWSYHRFVTVHFCRPWCSRFCESSLPAGRTYFQIAQATIAPYQEDRLWYLDYQWGGTFGGGFRAVEDDRGDVHITSRLWVS